MQFFFLIKFLVCVYVHNYSFPFLGNFKFLKKVIAKISAVFSSIQQSQVKPVVCIVGM